MHVDALASTTMTATERALAQSLTKQRDHPIIVLDKEDCLCAAQEGAIKPWSHARYRGHIAVEARQVQLGCRALTYFTVNPHMAPRLADKPVELA